MGAPPTATSFSIHCKWFTGGPQFLTTLEIVGTFFLVVLVFSSKKGIPSQGGMGSGRTPSSSPGTWGGRQASSTVLLD